MKLTKQRDEIKKEEFENRREIFENVERFAGHRNNFKAARKLFDGGGFRYFREERLVKVMDCFDASAVFVNRNNVGKVVEVVIFFNSFCWKFDSLKEVQAFLKTVL